MWLEKSSFIDEQLQFCKVKLKSATPVMENPPKLYVLKSSQHTYDTYSLCYENREINDESQTTLIIKDKNSWQK